MDLFLRIVLSARIRAARRIRFHYTPSARFDTMVRTPENRAKLKGNIMSNRSKLVRMRIENIGCIGAEGLVVELDEIVCLVGSNNSGKSTVLRAYEAAVNGEKLRVTEFHGKGEGVVPKIEIWVHIPEGTPNIDEKWKESVGDLLLVRSKWEWFKSEESPIRSTWNPKGENGGEYAEDGNAAGLDNVFKSRLPKPFRIGSLENPEEEHKQLLKIVLEPVFMGLRAQLESPESELRRKQDDFKASAHQELLSHQEKMNRVAQKINTSYRRVFNASEIELILSVGDLGIDLQSALSENSLIGVKEPQGSAKWSQQGTGSQRALFWSMLEVRSELRREYETRKLIDDRIGKITKEIGKLREKAAPVKEDAKKKHYEKIATLDAELLELEQQKNGKGESSPSDEFLPGYMLLIDEPETALHPSAIRAAKAHLYSLARDSGWQVMLTTHHPAFVDPLEDHTTIVRLLRSGTTSTPNVYRSDRIEFSAEEKANLQSLLAFDVNVAEMFFGAPVVIVEGDTEFAAFTELLNSNPEKYPIGERPLILRARGKGTIPILIRILAQFKVSFAVLHDIDSPRTKSGERKNPAYSVNSTICEAVAAARAEGSSVVHRCSCPNFEQHHLMELPEKDKPFAAWLSVRLNKGVAESVKNVLEELIKINGESSDPAHMKDGTHFQGFIRKWSTEHDFENPAFTFDANNPVATPTTRGDTPAVANLTEGV
jgi:putative ATP-dependent endonuclease of OLD family